MNIFIVRNIYTNEIYSIHSDYEDYYEALEEEGYNVNHWEFISIIRR